MKLSLVAAIAAGAALVSASPLRVIVVTNAVQRPDADPFAHMRFGHPAAVANPNIAHMMAPGGAQVAPPRRPCGGRGSRWRQKSLEIANRFRKAFGLPLIEPHHAPHHPPLPLFPGHLPGPNTPPSDAVTWNYVDGPNGHGWVGTLKSAGPVELKPIQAGHSSGHHNHAHHKMIHHMSGHHDTFFHRLQLAIMSLGPWEGRAVAFVIGAGIGVLLRMFWVLGVVAYRGCCTDSESNEYSPVVEFEDDEDDDEPRRGTPLSAPPQYVYPVDEKVGFEGTVKQSEVPAPATKAPADN